MGARSIPPKKLYILWGRAGGRCQYSGCNKILYRDELTKSVFNQAYVAHIVADSPKGPRGDKVRSFKLREELSNLMLLCDVHHRLIDKGDVLGHQEPLLVKMKTEHEVRIEQATGISAGMNSQIIIYKANIGKHTPPMNYEDLKVFLLPKYFPTSDSAIDLSISNSPFTDKNDIFWKTETENIELQFNEQIRPKIRNGILGHISIFAFAPMPLLVKLGVLLNDIHSPEIYQLIRETKSWKLDDKGLEIEHNIKYPNKIFKVAALNISLSATIDNERITKVLGTDCSIYTITIETPFNDYLRTKKTLNNFSKKLRILLDKIKLQHKSDQPLHVFPAMPIASAIELGKSWMPKADMPLYLYDENRNNGGFLKVLEIK